MKVAELIALLQAHDPDAEVMVWSPGVEDWMEAGELIEPTYPIWPNTKEIRITS